MTLLPRIAVGTVQSDADLQFILWALLDLLERSGLHVQAFSSQARLDARDAAVSITGQGRRHLDSWLMEPGVCAELFQHATDSADIGVVEGVYDSVAGQQNFGGSLDRLCEWLDVPQIAVINAAALDPCNPPVMPQGLAGILLDNLTDVEQLCRLQTVFEALYGVPVLGSLDRASHLRAAVANLPANGSPTTELCRALGSALENRIRLDKLVEIAARRSFTEVPCDLFRQRSLSQPLNIAVAYDDAFSCYFPDTLDALESQGATVSLFSPLRSECLPADSDIVYFGCGRPEQYIYELAANICMKESLWNHVICGRRVYAESAGLAYLCREIVMPCGRHLPMTGLLPGLARFSPAARPNSGVEVTMARGSWLFSTNETVRGYLNSKWIIHPDGCLVPLVSEAEHSHDLVGDYQIVGSRVHLNFASRPDYVNRFFQPCRSNRLNTVSR